MIMRRPDLLRALAQFNVEAVTPAVCPAAPGHGRTEPPRVESDWKRQASVAAGFFEMNVRGFTPGSPAARTLAAK